MEIELPGKEEHTVEEHPLILPVSVTISTLAVLIALVTLFGHRAATERILLQGKASDQWSYYQAKDIRLNASEGFAEVFNDVASSEKEKMAAAHEKWIKKVEKYDKDREEISNEAKKLEAERDVYGAREDRFDAGEAFLEIGLVICSLTLLTKRKTFWISGSVLGVVGVIIAATAFLVH
jgi:hypothetical protein